MFPPSVCITSDGPAHTAEVRDAETGERIPGVVSATIRIDGHEDAVAELEVEFPKVDVVAGATVTKVCPYCGHREEEG